MALLRTGAELGTLVTRCGRRRGGVVLSWAAAGPQGPGFYAGLASMVSSSPGPSAVTWEGLPASAPSLLPRGCGGWTRSWSWASWAHSQTCIRCSETFLCSYPGGPIAVTLVNTGESCVSVGQCTRDRLQLVYLPTATPPACSPEGGV